MKGRVTRAAAGVGAAGLALTMGAGPADAATRVQVSTTSLVLADGAAVAIPIRVTCDVGTNPSLNVEISQRSGRQVAKGTGGDFGFVCDGTPRVVQVFVHATQLAFSTGSAFVTANLFSCNLAFPPFPIPSSAGCSAKSSRTTRLVPGEFRDDSAL